MLKLKLKTLALAAATAFAIQSFAQTTYRYVPDSLTCITPTQDVFFIQQSFTVKELSASNVLKQKEVNALITENNFLRVAIDESKKETGLYSLSLQQSKQDNLILSKQLTVANRRRRGAKAGFTIVCSIAVIELGVIAIQRIR